MIPKFCTLTDTVRKIGETQVMRIDEMEIDPNSITADKSKYTGRYKCSWWDDNVNGNCVQMFHESELELFSRDEDLFNTIRKSD